MNRSLQDALVDLLEASIALWTVAPDVKVKIHGEHDVIVVTPQLTLTIARAPAGMPFRWVVKTDDRTRTAASIPGVLRIIRQHLSPTYEPLKVTIGPLPPTAS